MTDATQAEQPKRIHLRGRPKGSGKQFQQKSRVQLLLEAARSNGELSSLAVDDIAEIKDFFHRMAFADPENIEKWMLLWMKAAVSLAPYQSPTYSAIQVTGNSVDQAKLAKMSDAELAMALKERVESLGMEVKIRSKLEYRAKHFQRGVAEEILNGPQIVEENEG